MVFADRLFHTDTHPSPSLSQGPLVAVQVQRAPLAPLPTAASVGGQDGGRSAAAGERGPPPARPLPGTGGHFPSFLPQVSEAAEKGRKSILSASFPTPPSPLPRPPSSSRSRANQVVPRSSPFSSLWALVGEGRVELQLRAENGCKRVHG